MLFQAPYDSGLLNSILAVIITVHQICTKHLLIYSQHSQSMYLEILYRQYQKQELFVSKYEILSSP